MMKKNIFFIFIFICKISLNQTYYNKIYNYQSSGMSILNCNNELYVYGVIIDSNKQKVFIKKVDSLGNELLNKNYSFNSNYHFAQHANNFIKCKDQNLIFCGLYSFETSDNKIIKSNFVHSVDNNKEFKQNIFLVKIDTNLNIIWSKIFQDSNLIYPWGIIELQDKGIAITGGIRNTPSLEYDMLFIRADSNGNELWRKQYGGIFSETAYNNTIQTFDKGFLLGGYVHNPNISGSSQALIIKTDSNGNEQWQLQLGEQNLSNNIAFVTQLLDTNYLIIADTAIATSNPDWSLHTIKMYKINQQRQILWTKVYNKPDALFVIRSLNKVNDNEFIISGMEKFRWDSIEYGSYGGFLFKFTSEGDSLWWRNYQYFTNNADWNTLYDVALNGNGFVSCGSTYPIAHQDSVFTWLISIDSMGCLTPGCDTTTGPIITQQPSNDTVYKNHNAYFQVNVTGTPVLRYQWQTCDGTNWVNIAENTQFTKPNTAKLRILNVPFALHQSQYRCKIWNNYDSLYSDTVQLFVDTTENINEIGYFKNCIQLQSLCTGSALHFTCCPKAENLLLQYSVYDLQGRTIKSGDIFTSENNNIFIGNLQQGMYIVSFAYNNKKMVVAKFVVSKVK